MSNAKIAIRSKYYYQGVKSLDGNTYRLTFRYNTYNGKYYLDIFGLNNDVDVKGLAVLPGKNHLRKHGYYDLGELWLIDNSGANENPGFDDMGTRWTLEYTPLSDL